MEAWNPPASALELLPVEVEDARSHNLGLSQGSAGLRTVHATQFPVSGFGFLLFTWLMRWKGQKLCLGKRIDLDTHLWGCLCLLSAGTHYKQRNLFLRWDCQASFSFSVTSAHSCDKSGTHWSENTGSLLAVTLKSILEMPVGSGCQLFNAVWGEEGWEKNQPTTQVKPIPVR